MTRADVLIGSTLWLSLFALVALRAPWTAALAVTLHALRIEALVRWGFATPEPSLVKGWAQVPLLVVLAALTVAITTSGPPSAPSIARGLAVFGASTGVSLLSRRLIARATSPILQVLGATALVASVVGAHLGVALLLDSAPGLWASLFVGPALLVLLLAPASPRPDSEPRPRHRRR